MTKEPLSKSQIAWITSGIIVGALILVFTTACLVHRCKQRYDGVLISSALKNKENRHRPNQRYKGERVVFLEHGTKEKLDKVTKFWVDMLASCVLYKQTYTLEWGQSFWSDCRWKYPKCIGYVISWYHKEQDLPVKAKSALPTQNGVNENIFFIFSLH